MGQCFSCRQSQARFRDKGTKICGHIQSAVSPLHVPHEEAPNPTNGHVLAATREQQAQPQTSAEPCTSTLESFTGSFSNMNITNPLKGLVSKQRNRYKKDGFDLDLTYITENIIAMGYPASKIEGIYRNHIDDVYKFLEMKHKDHYFIYNLCSEKSYDPSKFHGRVASYPFDDHNPPKVELIEPFCENVHKWLTADERNVAVVHCKAGKGRTGTMICCYLLHSGKFRTAAEALSHYGKERTQDQKGVTIPSQLRYVNYYARMVTERLAYDARVVYLREILLEPVPMFAGGQGLMCFSISKQTITTDKHLRFIRLYKSQNYEVRRGQPSLRLMLDVCVPLAGDIKLQFYNRTKIRKEKQFHLWFNTAFLEEVVKEDAGEGTSSRPAAAAAPEKKSKANEKSYSATFTKKELDVISKKDKQHKVYVEYFKVTVFLEDVPEKEKGVRSWPREAPKLLEAAAAAESPNNSSAAEESSESDEEEEWDSGELPLLAGPSETKSEPNDS